MYQLAEYFWLLPFHDGVSFHASYEQLFVDEVRKTQHYVLPYLALSVFLVTSFCMLSMLEGHQDGFSHALESGLGMITIGMSILSSLGLLFFLGSSYNFVVACMPFVVLCVSVDNDFLLLASLRATNARQLSSSSSKRLGEALEDAGPSVTITSLTDILCFAIGCVSAVPAVSNFCLFTAVALTIRYVYQLTFYIAILAYGVENRLICCRRMKPKRQNVDETNLSNEHFMHRFFRIYWSRFLMTRPVKVLTIVIYILYLSISLIYAANLRINITPSRIVVTDSKLSPVFRATEKFRSSSSIIGHVIVLQPPDLRNSSNRRQVLDFVHQLKQTPYFSNETSTASVWLTAYVDYYEFLEGYDDQNGSTDEEYAPNFYLDLPDFLKNAQAKKYVSDIHWNPQTPSATDSSLKFTNGTENDDGSVAPNLQSFQFKFYFRNVRNWDNHIQLMLHWRQTCSRFPDLDAMVVDRNNLNPYLDEMMTIGPTTLQTMGIALVSIVLATALMMPDIVGIFYISLSFISVDIGVIGFLNIWNCDLDMATTTGILMTIGFSVYYTARICYSYQTCLRHENTSMTMSPVEKLSHTMGAVGWPVLQGGIGTALGIMPLVFVKSYITLAFFKTITLVVLFGLYHGLVLMPVVMTSLDSTKRAEKQLNYWQRRRFFSGKI